MQQGTIFGCFRQCSVIIKLLNMENYVLFEPNAFLHHQGKFICILWWLEHLHFWHSATMWLGSIFGCFGQCSVIIKYVINMDKYVLFEPSSFLHQSGKVYMQEFMVVCAPSFLALNNNVAGQHFWLLQAVFSHNKSC